MHMTTPQYPEGSTVTFNNSHEDKHHDFIALHGLLPTAVSVKLSPSVQDAAGMSVLCVALVEL